MISRSFKKIVWSTAVTLVGSLLVSTSWAACNNNTTQTNASLTQLGVHSCSIILGQDGTPMTDITANANVTATQNGAGVDWSAPANADVDYVIVRGQIGMACAYNYGPGATGGQGLTGSFPVGFAPVTKFCSDGMLPKPEPINTADATCTGDAAALQAAVTGNSTYIAAIGVGQNSTAAQKDPGQAQLSICAESLTECDNQCYRPADYPGNTQGSECVPDANGALPLSCRPCELATQRAPMRGANYCWELTHGVDANAGTFRPTRVTQPGEVTWQTYEGSACYLFTTRFYGAEYSYYSPTGCNAP